MPNEAQNMKKRKIRTMRPRRPKNSHPSAVGSRQSTLSRSDALRARPLQVPPVNTEEKGAKLYVTVKYRRPRWQRVLGAETCCNRTYGLDNYGREVYEACDGSISVQGIIARFAKHHGLSRAEAEKAVTAFMKTLMSRGIIGMAMEEPQNED